MKGMAKDIALKHEGTSLIAESAVRKTADELGQYVKKLCDVIKSGSYNDAAEASVNLPSDAELLDKVKEIASQKGINKLKYIVVVGIGGSSLGTKAVYDALHGYFDMIDPGRFPKMIFADTNDPGFFLRFEKFLKSGVEVPEEILIHIISKSGGTTESIANAELIMAILNKRFGNIKDRVVIITDFESRLWKQAKEKEISRLSVPELVGGRYSVFSAVGILPLYAAGIDVDSLREGAGVMRDRCVRSDIQKNPAAISALLIYLHSKEGKLINNNFFFHPELESLGEWYRQLMGESIGKERDAEGNIVHAGITPIVSVGSADLHSMAQLYLGGPRDKFTNFVYTSCSGAGISVPDDLIFPGLVDGIEGKDFSDIMSAIFRGVRTAYKNAGLPFMEVDLLEINEYAIGQYLQFKMIEMMYLARLLGLNAFDQPNVEDYKKETKKLLNK